MIQAVALLLCGVAAVGLWRTESFVLLLACWTLGLVLHAGLAAASRVRRTAVAAREAFLAESAGACLLAMSGLALVLAAETPRLGTLEERLAMLPQDDSLRAWAGAGALLAAAGRLGLPPLPWWPARLAAAPPAARVFLLVGLHPATAILLRLRLDGWLQPWQASLALWLGGGGALLLMLAAAGERHAARRAAWLGASHWSGLLAAGSQATLAAIWVLAAGMVLVQLQTVMVRWPVAVRRTLLAIGGLALAAAGLLSGLARADSAPAVLRLAAATLAVWVLGCWWRETSGDRFLRPGEPSRRPALAFLAPWARMGQRKGPLPALAGMAVPGLGRIASGFDRIVLAGLVEGLDRVGHGAGWLVAWTDRRGQDAVWSGASRLLGLAGRATVRVASDRPRRLLILGLLAILGLAWIGGSLG